MSVSIRRRVLAVIWCLCVLCIAETVARADDTALIIASEAGDPIGAGQQLTLAAPENGVRVRTSYLDETTVSVGGAGPVLVVEWQIVFKLPWSGVPKRGVYAVSSTGLSSPSTPRFVVRSPKGTYSSLDGSFEIKKSTFSETGLSSLWFTFDVRVPGSSGALRGEVRYHADSTEAGINQAPVAVTLLTDVTTLDTPTVLEAHPTDDDLPIGGFLTSAWEILGTGASHGEIADPAATLTTVTFHEPGNYKLRLHVSDGEKSSDWPREIRVPVPASRNLLHLAGPPGLIHHSQSELLNAQPPWNLYTNSTYTLSTNSTYTSDEFYFYTVGTRWEVTTNSSSGKRLVPGVYEPATAVGGAQVPGLTFSIGQARSRASKFEVRPGSRPADGTRAAAAWITFSLYGLEDESIALGEMRYNMVPSTVLDAPPIVDAGMDREFTRTSVRRLHGAAMAVVGASEAPVTTMWSLVSGPGEVTFADPTKPETDVTFSAPGLYRLRLTASQGPASASDEVAITVHSGETSLLLRDLRDTGAGSASYLTAADYDFKVTEFTGQTLKVSCDKRHPSTSWNANEQWRLTFLAPSGEQLGLKHYIDNGFASSTQATLLVTRGDWYQQFEGDFLITELALDEQGKIASLRVRFTAYTMDGNGRREELPLTGELRLRTDVSQDPANRVPRISAGPPQYLSGRTDTVLAGVFDDDLLPVGKPLIATWQVISGPGTAQLSGSNPGASVNFSARGTYVLRYTASDGEYSASDDVTIVVGSGAETYQGYVSENQVLYGPFKVRMLSSGKFTGSVTIGKSRLPLRGKFTNGYWSWSVPLREGGDLAVALYRSPSDGAISGTLRLNSTLLTLVATQTSDAFLRATREASPFAAAYTWITELPQGNEGPHGFSFGTAKVSRDGAVRFTGRLSDGRAISYGGFLGLDGWVPLFWDIPLVEQFSGPVQFYTAADGFHFHGAIQWMRRPNPKSARFAEGFQFIAKLIGSRYTPPGAGTNLLTRTAEPLTLNALSFAPSWPGGRQDELTLRTNNVFVSSSDLTLKADRRTGLFRGTFTDPQRKKRTFQGAILQAVQVGGGHFATKEDTGAVYLKVE